jgi:hypothetical protein
MLSAFLQSQNFSDAAAVFPSSVQVVCTLIESPTYIIIPGLVTKVSGVQPTLNGSGRKNITNFSSRINETSFKKARFPS